MSSTSSDDDDDDVREAEAEVMVGVWLELSLVERVSPPCPPADRT
jgi:hypothetical protein